MVPHFSPLCATAGIILRRGPSSTTKSRELGDPGCGRRRPVAHPDSSPTFQWGRSPAAGRSARVQGLRRSWRVRRPRSARRRWELQHVTGMDRGRIRDLWVEGHDRVIGNSEVVGDGHQVVASPDGVEVAVRLRWTRRQQGVSIAAGSGRRGRRGPCRRCGGGFGEGRLGRLRRRNRQRARGRRRCSRRCRSDASGSRWRRSKHSARPARSRPTWRRRKPPRQPSRRGVRGRRRWLA